MKGFVDRRGQARTGSPTPTPLNATNSSRQQRAQQARINPHQLGQKSASPAPQRSGLNTTADYFSGPSALPQGKPEAHRQRDRYDTDGESIADTTGPINLFQPIENQALSFLPTSGGIFAVDHTDPVTHYENDNNMQASHDEDQQYDADEIQSIDHHQFDQGLISSLQQRTLRLETLNQVDRYNGYSSYPTTTDGRLEESEHPGDEILHDRYEESGHANGRPDEEGRTEHDARHAPLLPLPPPPQQRQSHPSHNNNVAQQPSHTLMNRRSGRQPLSQLQSSGQIIRPQSVATTRNAPVGVNLTFPDDDEPNFFSKPVIQQSKPTLVPQFNSGFQSILPVPQGGSGPSFDVVPRSRTTIPVVESSPTDTVNIPRQQIQSEEPNTEPLIDYDPVDLYAMPFTDLQNESFDFNPRGSPSILPENIQRAPLTDQLAWVLKNCPGSEQEEAFFGSLTMDEWEDAGSWFVDQFSNLMKRATTARQAKRKYAREMEDKIKARNDEIERKQSQLTEAVQGMKSKGREVLLTPSKPRA